MNCPNCTKQVEDEWVSCPYCKADLPKTRLCSKCSKELQHDWVSCPFCGQDDNEESGVESGISIGSDSVNKIEQTVGSHNVTHVYQGTAPESNNVTKMGETCNSCGKLLKDDWFVCPECGKKMCEGCRDITLDICEPCAAPIVKQRELEAVRAAELLRKREEEQTRKQEQEIEEQEKGEEYRRLYSECTHKFHDILKAAPSVTEREGGRSFNEITLKRIRTEDLQPLLKYKAVHSVVATGIYMYEAEKTDIGWQSKDYRKSTLFNSLGVLGEVFGMLVLTKLLEQLVVKLKKHIDRQDMLVRTKCNLSSIINFLMRSKRKVAERNDLVVFDVASVLYGGDGVSRFDDFFVSEYIKTLDAVEECGIEYLKDILCRSSYPILFDHSMVGTFLDMLILKPSPVDVDNVVLLDLAYKKDIDQEQFGDLINLLNIASFRYKSSKKNYDLIILKCIIYYLCGKDEAYEGTKAPLKAVFDELWDEHSFKGVMSSIGIFKGVVDQDKQMEWLGGLGGLKILHDNLKWEIMATCHRIGRPTVPYLVRIIDEIADGVKHAKADTDKEYRNRQVENHGSAEEALVDVLEGLTDESFESSMLSSKSNKVAKWWKKEGSRKDWKNS